MSIGALVAIFATSFLVGLTGALSPGPLTTLAIREGMRRGFLAGPVLAAGHAVIELALVVALALGLNRALDEDWVAAMIALAGGIFLLWLGTQIIRTAPRQELVIGGDRGDEGPPPPTGRGWLRLAAPERGRLTPAAAAGLAASGMAVSVANPFWLLWWATVGAAYVATSLEEGVAGISAFYGAHVLSDLAWLSLIAFVLATGRRIMSRLVYQGVLMVCGLFLLGLGGWFLASGLGYVF